LIKAGACSSLLRANDRSAANISASAEHNVSLPESVTTEPTGITVPDARDACFANFVVAEVDRHAHAVVQQETGLLSRLIAEHENHAPLRAAQ
jgi:hypothetical protein